MATVEATTQKVQRFLINAFGDVKLRRNGGFAIEHGSTACIVEVMDWVPDKDGAPQSLVRVSAPIGRDVRPSPDLFKWIVTEAQQVLFGKIGLYDQGDGHTFLVFEHILLGDFIDSAELTTAVLAVIFSADKLDDEVLQRFGGKRYTDA